MRLFFRCLRAYLNHRPIPWRVIVYKESHPDTIVQPIRFTRERLNQPSKILNAFGWSIFFVTSWKLSGKLLNSGADKENELQKQQDGNTSPHGNTVETVRPQKIGEEQAVLSTGILPFFKKGSVIIPLGWPKKLPKKPYKGDDPEWQEFLRYNRDPERLEMLQDELVDLLRRAAIKMFRDLGEPVELGLVTLWPVFPDYAPPEYERSALEISSDGIRWTTRPVARYNYYRIRRDLWPKALWESFRASYVQALKEIKQVWELNKPNRPSNSDQSGQSSSSKTADDHSKTSNPQADSAVAPKDHRSPSTSPNPSQGITADMANKSTTSSNPASNDTRKPKIIINAPLAKPGGSISSITLAFRKKLAEEWSFAPYPPERGDIHFIGTIEIRGRRGFVILDLHAWYSPKEARWRGILPKEKLKQDYAQSPKG